MTHSLEFIESHYQPLIGPVLLTVLLLQVSSEPEIEHPRTASSSSPFCHLFQQHPIRVSDLVSYQIDSAATCVANDVLLSSLDLECSAALQRVQCSSFLENY